MKAQVDAIESSIGQIVGRPLMNVPLCVHLRVITVAIHFVNKHFELDLFVHFVRLQNGFVQFGERFDVIVTGIDDEHQCATSFEYHFRIECRIEEINLSGKIPYLELHEAAVVDIIFDNFIRGLEEQRLVRRHLVEDDFLDGTLAGATQAHQ